MKFFNDIRLRQAEKLAEKGFRLLEDEEFDQALNIAGELRRQRFSAGFDIAAQAHAGKGDLATAVRVLEEGVEKVPDAWLNWQLLGNYRSDLGLFTEAGLAYERALECPGVSPSSVRLNQAILANRTADYSAALRLAGEVDDPDLKIWAAAVQVGALAEMGRGEEAERLGLQTLSGAGEDADPDRLCSIAADVARVRLKRGDPKPDIRDFVIQWLEKEPKNRRNDYLLTVLRDLDGLYSETAQYYRLLVRGEIPANSPLAEEVVGFFSTWHVVADSPEEALGFVKELDLPPAHLTIEEWEVLEPRPNEPKGVYWRTGRAYFEEED